MNTTQTAPDQKKEFWILYGFSLLLLGVSFEPLNLYPFVFIGMIPYFRALSKTKTKKELLWANLFFGVLFSIIQFYWVHTVLAEFSRLPLYETIPLFLLFTLVGQPQFILFCIPLRFLLDHLKKSPGAFYKCGLALTIASFYAGFDWLLPKLFVDTFGVAFTENEILKQAVDLGGPSLLTFFIVFINVTLYSLFFETKDREEPSLLPPFLSNLSLIALSCMMSLFFYSYGKNRLEQYSTKEQTTSKKMKGAIIQANIGDVDKLSAESGYRHATEKVMNTYFSLSQEALKKYPQTEVLFWPETAYPSDFGSPLTSEEFVRDRSMMEFSARVNKPIVFGGYYTDENKIPYNASFFLSPTAEVQRYFKTILLWFGETIPFIDFFPQLRKQFPMVGFFGRGPGPSVYNLLGVPVEPLICYEALFPFFTAEGVKKGAKIILNFTNDSWFGEHGAPYYHFRLAHLRSIETRTPQVRITNTGFSALILPSGKIINRSQLFQPEIIPVEIPLFESASKTLMVSWGDWFFKVCILFSTCVLAYLFFKKK